MITSLKTFLRKIMGISALEEQINRLEQVLKNQQQQSLNNIQLGSILGCNINNVEMLVPVELLKTYPHCLQLHPEGKFTYEIETQCTNWMISHLQPGDVVLDIGAAFGVISLPLAEKVGDSGHVYAFEPAKRTQKFLQQILKLNHYDNVSLVQLAVSDQPSTAEFIEYSGDDNCSWASDTSTLNAPTVNPQHNHETYRVEVTTIDDFVNEWQIKPKSIKIDIEGFELYALHGAKSTLTTYKPYLCIDIHKDIKTGKSALEGVKPFLLNLGYELKMEAYTLYCTPKS